MNLHDIAKECGVSIATVSRVLNNSPLVSETTRKKVQTVIDKYQYTPNALARSLIKNNTKTVGVLAIDIRGPYFSAIVHRFEQEMTSLGYNIFLCNTSGDLERKKHYIRILLERKVDALVFVGSVYKEKNSNQHIIDAAKKVPVILLNNHIKGENIYCILCDDFSGTYKSTKHLLNKRRHNIIYIHNADTFSGINKLKGFQAALKEYTIPNNPQRIITTFPKVEPFLDKVKQAYLQSPFDAIVTSDDIYANRIINCLHNLNIKVPEQISVMGYNNSSICDYTHPALSTVDSCMNELGLVGAQITDGILNGYIPEKQVQLLPPKLIIRNTC